MRDFGRYLREAKIRLAGDEIKGKTLIGFARTLLGTLIQDAAFNKLPQHYRQYRFYGGVVIDVAMHHGQYEIGIYVPYEQRGGTDVEICTGFIVQLTRTSHVTDGSIHMQPWGLEPQYDYVEPGIAYADAYGTEQGNWLYPGRYRLIGQDGVTVSWASSGLNDHWSGEIVDNFFSTENGYYHNHLTLGLNEEYSNIISEFPATGPRVVRLVDSSSALIPYDFFDSSAWGIPYVGANRALVDANIITGDAAADQYHANVDYANSLMQAGQTPEHSRTVGLGGVGRMAMSGTANYLLAFEWHFDSDSDYHIGTAERADLLPEQLSNDAVPEIVGKSTLALLPPGSVIRDDGTYDYASDPDYAPFSSTQYPYTLEGSEYNANFEYLIDQYGPLPSIPGSGPQEDLVPASFIHPLMGIAFYPYDSQFLINTRTLTAEVLSNAQSGYYTVEVPAWKYNGTVYTYNASNRRLDGVEFDLEITLFGTKMMAKRTLHGITGQQADQLRILVNTPIEYKIGHEEEVFAQMLIIDR